MLGSFPVFAGVSLIAMTYIFQKSKREVSGRELILLGLLKVVGGALILIGLLM